MKTTRLLVGACAALACTPALAQFSVEGMRESAKTTPIRTEKIADGFYVLFGVGGNIGVSIGEQGVLIVDDQFMEIAPKYQAAIRELGGDAIDFAINTHWHFDHSDGNRVLGPAGTWLVSHEHSRQMMMKNNEIEIGTTAMKQPAYPPAALPIISFDERMKFHFNAERIDLMHLGPAHTAGDIAVFFRGRNIVHLGDVLVGSYPPIDTSNGGSLEGMIAFCEAALEQIDANTVVIPGHGAVSSYEGLVAYVDMLTKVRDRLEPLVARGATLEQVIAAKLTAEWDAARGNPAVFLAGAYASLKR
jgi:cyclase